MTNTYSVFENYYKIFSDFSLSLSQFKFFTLIAKLFIILAFYSQEVGYFDILVNILIKKKRTARRVRCGTGIYDDLLRKVYRFDDICTSRRGRDTLRGKVKFSQDAGKCAQKESFGRRCGGGEKGRNYVKSLENLSEHFLNSAFARLAYYFYRSGENGERVYALAVRLFSISG